MDDLRARLVRDAFLYDDPAAYTAGVEAALRAAARIEQLGGSLVSRSDDADVAEATSA